MAVLYTTLSRQLSVVFYLSNLSIYPSIPSIHICLFTHHLSVSLSESESENVSPSAVSQFFVTP